VTLVLAEEHNMPAQHERRTLESSLSTTTVNIVENYRDEDKFSFSTTTKTDFNAVAEEIGFTDYKTNSSANQQGFNFVIHQEGEQPIHTNPRMPADDLFI
jgi:hypothetical protein